MSIATTGPFPTGTVTYYPTAATNVEFWARKLVAASQLGEALARTSFVPAQFRGKPEECTAAILYGDELGFSPMASLQHVFVIGGKPSLYARAMVALLISKGHTVETVSKTDDAVTVRGRRAGSERWIEETWTVERAHRAGYTSNTKYRSDPQSMLLARSQADVCRQVAPDVLAGVAYTVEELEVSDAEAADPAPQAPASGPERARQALAAARTEKAPQEAEEDAVTVAMNPPAPGYPEGTAAAYPDPMADPDPEPADRITDAQRRALFKAFTAAGFKTDARSDEGRQNRLTFIRNNIGRDVETTNDLSKREASLVIDLLNVEAERLAAEAPAGGEQA